MDVRCDFSGSFDIVDEFFTYPPGDSAVEGHEDYEAGELEHWQSRLYEYEAHTDSDSTPALSRSSSLPSDMMESPKLISPTANSDFKNGSGFRLTWPNERHIRGAFPSSRKFSETANLFASKSMEAVTSPDATPTDSHHEGSCAKCRMTAAEARKCRLERRREQNRASQRKFRARKEAKLREAAGQVATLETYVELLEKHNSELESMNAELRQKMAALENAQRKVVTSAESPARQVSSNGASVAALPEHGFRRQPSTASLTEHKAPVYELCPPLFDHELEPASHELNNR